MLAVLAHGLAVAVLLGRPVTPVEPAGSPAPTPSIAAMAPGAWAATRPTPVAATTPVLPAPTGTPTGVPVGLVIPAIGLNQPRLVQLGMNPDGSLEVPTDYSLAGWFTGGPRPGAPGPAVIAGHVDSKMGPGVFFRLRSLRVNDVIIVRMSGGQLVRFTVDAVRDYPKSGFPTGLVYGPVPGAALRLITCGGSFDRSAGSYRDNIVVYATLRT